MSTKYKDVLIKHCIVKLKAGNPRLLFGIAQSVIKQSSVPSYLSVLNRKYTKYKDFEGKKDKNPTCILHLLHNIVDMCM